LPNQKSNIINTVVIITAATAASKLLGFVREMVIAYVFGAGAVTDAYAVAARFVTTAGLLVSVYLAVVFVPTYVRIRQNQGEESALRFSNNAVSVSFTINVLLMILLQIGAPLVLRFTGFGAEQASLALVGVRIALLQLPFLTFVHFFGGYLTARKSFLGPNLIGIPLNIATIALCLVLGTQSGVVGLTIACSLGIVAQILVYLIWLPKEKYRYSFLPRFNTPEMRAGVKILIPALLGSALIELNLWVDTFIATFLGEGNVAAIVFASRLISFVSGLIVFPAAGMAFAYMSEYAARNEISKMLGTLWRTIRMILFVVLPIIIISIPSGFDIVRLVYQRGQFTLEATILTGSALIWYLPGLLGLALHTFLLRFFYVLQDTKTPMFCGIFSISVNIVLSIILSRYMGIAGIALATSVGSGLSSVLLLIALRLKLGPMGFGETARDSLKLLVCVAPCALAVLGVRFLLQGQNSLIRFAASVCVGGIIYIISAFLLKGMALRDLIEILRARFIKTI